MDSEEAISLTLFEHTVSADRAELFRRQADHNDQLDTVLVFFDSQKLHHFVRSSLKSGEERILDVVVLKDEESDFLASKNLPVIVKHDFSPAVQTSQIEISTI